MGRVQALVRLIRSRWVEALCWLLLAVGLLAVLLRQAADLQPAVFAPLGGLAVAAAFTLARGWREWGVLLAYVVAMFFFVQLRDAADETGLRVLTAYVIDWEKWMFGGEVPSAWLQARIGGAAADPGAAAVFAALVHWTWFIFPHAAVFGAYLWARKYAWRVTIMVALTFYLGLALYFTVPTAPPWLAGEQGLLDGVVRGMHAVGPLLLGQGFYDWAFEAMAEPNPVAAMPSLHFAASFVVVGVGILLRSWKLIAVALLYSAALTFALVYLGEHYLADVIAGAAVALIAFGAVEGGRWGRYWLGERRAQLARWGQRGAQWLREALRLPPIRIQAP